METSAADSQKTCTAFSLITALTEGKAYHNGTEGDAMERSEDKKLKPPELYMEAMGENNLGLKYHTQTTKNHQ